jgi:site-specific recombinase XerD
MRPNPAPLRVLSYSFPQHPPAPGPVIVSDSDTADDERLIEMWLNLFRSPNTRESYGFAVRSFRAHVAKPLAAVTVDDLQDWLDTDQAPATKNARMTAIRSLYRTGMDTGYLRFNPTAVLRLHGVKENRAEKILSESDVATLLQYPMPPRNRALLFLLYAGGLRISEAINLKWRDFQRVDGGFQITVFGKGEKTRVVRLPVTVGEMIENLSNVDSDSDTFIFHKARDPSRPMCRIQAHRIIKSIAERAGVNHDVSAHWFRHAHASHSLDHGAPLPLVQKTLGHSSIKTTGLYLHCRPDESSGLHLVLPEPVL